MLLAVSLSYLKGTKNNFLCRNMFDAYFRLSRGKKKTDMGSTQENNRGLYGWKPKYVKEQIYLRSNDIYLF